MTQIAEILYAAAELAGVVAFAISGAMLAIDRDLDLFGVLFLGSVTALGGGVIRDLLLGITPPMMFQDYSYLITAVITSLAVFAIAVFFRDFYRKRSPLIDKITNVFDAMGLGLFSVLGVGIAYSAGYGDNAFYCIFMGMTTGIGGGLTRDVMTNSTPLVLRKHIYAVASLAGALMHYGMLRTGSNETLSIVAPALTVFIIRMLATRFKWNFPRAPH